jgi:hypothetical protein
MFDQADRVRHAAAFTLNYAPGPAWLFSAAMDYLSDDYDEGFFGLNKNLRSNFTVDANYAPDDRYGFVAYFNRDRTNFTYRGIARGAGAFVWALENEWDRTTRDLVDTFGIGANVTALDEQRLRFDVSYDLSFAQQMIRTFNPRAPRPESFTDASAWPFPDVKNRFHEFRVDASYRMRPELQLGTRYLFEPYRLDDYALDIMQPYMLGFEAPENDTRRSIYLNSRHASSDAHLFGVYIRYTF